MEHKFHKKKIIYIKDIWRKEDKPSLVTNIRIYFLEN